SGNSDAGSVEQMSSRELKFGCSSTGFYAGVWTAGGIRRTRWTSGWKERTRSIISSLDRRTLLSFLSRRLDELFSHMDRYCCASVILKNWYVSSCLAKRMSEMALSYLFSTIRGTVNLLSSCGHRCATGSTVTFLVRRHTFHYLNGPYFFSR